MFIEPYFVDTNGLKMAVYEQGDGPAVVLLHGFPELAFSWRFQIPALANAGFRAIAPDQRGYGLTGGPDGVAQYAMVELIKDIHGMLDACGLKSATFVGHDWGALVMWHLAMHSPQRIDGLIGLNIPHIPRPPTDPISLFRARFGDDFYIVNFQDSDEADRAFATDPEHFFDMLMRKNQIPRAVFDRLPNDKKIIQLIPLMEQKEASGEPLLNRAERDYFASMFARSGFTKPINWYRNWTRNWAAFDGIEQSIDVPTLFIGAADELVVGVEHIEAMKPLFKDLTVHMIEPCGHWSQQEHPEEVNRIMIDWLSTRVLG